MNLPSAKPSAQIWTRAPLWFALAVALLSPLLACGDDSGGGGVQPRPDDFDYTLERVFPDLDFRLAVDLQHAGDGSGRIFVVEKAGIIRVLDPENASSSSVFLDISDRVESGSSVSDERGLLGLAFHPDFEFNGWFFVYYTSTSGNQARLSRFVASGTPPAGDAESEAILLELVQPFGNHNGGAVFFDNAGHLYLSLGDGGSGGDPQDNGQDRSTLLASLLRLDVDTGSEAEPFHSIPANNPFVGNAEGWREEIYAWGLRNAWRVSFDGPSSTIWAGDVGQGRREEINRIVAGGNYGWDCREGFDEYSGSSSDDCNGASGFIDPVYDYGRSNGDVSVTGGYVYRGPTVSSLTGRYVFADYASGRIWVLDESASPTTALLLVDSDMAISSFGVDQDNELYVLEYRFQGGIHRLVEAEKVTP